MQHVIHWFRRDLRLNDNTSLHYALSSEYPVKCVFIFDKNILCQLPKQDKRIQFIHDRLSDIRGELQKYGSDLWVYYGEPFEVWKELAKEEHLKMVFTNRDYEPYAQQRDKAIYELLLQKEIQFKGYKDQVIFEKKDILSGKGTPYTVYTPFMKAWKKKFQENSDTYIQEFNIELENKKLLPQNNSEFLSLEKIGFQEVKLPNVPTNLKGINIDDYDEMRDIPAEDKTTRLGTALRFGALSVREAVTFAIQYNETYWNELIWREFFMQIMYNFPKVEKQAFREKYDRIEWRNNEEEFKLWCEGKTGFPIVDAGMRELNATGFMHNRVRMITASFLVKDLLIDWRWGEAYFAEKLLDFDLSANNGNWQWAAGTGTDAAPYFRIFNPESQQKKFDPDLKYIKKWVPEFGTSSYPKQMVDRKQSRERCLAVYKKVV